MSYAAEDDEVFYPYFHKSQRKAIIKAQQKKTKKNKKKVNWRENLEEFEPDRIEGQGPGQDVPSSSIQQERDRDTPGSSTQREPETEDIREGTPTDKLGVLAEKMLAKYEHIDMESKTKILVATLKRRQLRRHYRADAPINPTQLGTEYFLLRSSLDGHQVLLKTNAVVGMHNLQKIIRWGYTSMVIRCATGQTLVWFAKMMSVYKSLGPRDPIPEFPQDMWYGAIVAAQQIEASAYDIISSVNKSVRKDKRPDEELVEIVPQDKTGQKQQEEVDARPKEKTTLQSQPHKDITLFPAKKAKIIEGPITINDQPSIDDDVIALE